MAAYSDSAAVDVGNSQEQILEFARNLMPIGDLSASNLQTLCRTAQVVQIHRNDPAKPEQQHRWLSYVMAGEVSLVDSKRVEQERVQAGTPRAREPLFRESNSTSGLTSKTVATVIKFGREQLEVLLREQQKAATHVVEAMLSEADNMIVDSMLEDMQKGQLRFLVDPSVGGRIARTVQTEGVDITDLVQICMAEPAVCAYVTKAAVEAGADDEEEVSNMRAAIQRLGADATRKLMASLPKQYGFKPNSEVIYKAYRLYLRRATLTAALCKVMSGRAQLNSEVAQLTGMTLDIGELAILSYANRLPKEMHDLQVIGSSVTKMRSMIGSWMISHWGLNLHCLNAVMLARDWYRQPAGSVSYADIATAALLVLEQEMPGGTTAVSNIESLLLTRKLQSVGINLRDAANILKAASGELALLNELLEK